MAEKFRVTYATMSADNEELHKHYDEGIDRAKAELGKSIPVVVNGEERAGARYQASSSRRRTARVHRAHLAGHTPQDVEDAVAAAKGVRRSSGIGWAGRSTSRSSTTRPT